MTLASFAFLSLNGLTLAALLFIMASGLTLAFGLMRVVNLAHGAFFMLGGYVGVAVVDRTGSLLAGLAAGAGASLVAGVEMERLLLARVRGLELSEALLTIAIGMAIADALLAVFGGHPKSLAIPDAWRMRVDLGFVHYPAFRLAILVFAAGLALGLSLLLTRTRLGAAIRAGVDDRETAESQGINVSALFALVFALASALAGIAGVVGANYLALAPDTGVRVLMLSLVVIIIGGLGSLPGAAAGALLTGLATSFANAFVPQFALFILFAPLALVLALRPQGLFGRSPS
jgi:branched-chain amino acid transport system permease protein